MFLKVQLHAMDYKRDRVDLYSINVYLFLVDQIQIRSKGYNDCTFEGITPVTSRWTPRGTNLAHFFLTVYTQSPQSATEILSLTEHTETEKWT